MPSAPRPRCSWSSLSTGGALRLLQRPVQHQSRPHRPQREPRRSAPSSAACPAPCRPRRGRCWWKQPPAVLERHGSDRQPGGADRRGHPLLQIEGRLKGLDYVKNVTAWYRQKLDAILERRPDLVAASAGRCSYGFTPDPKKSFNRAAPTTSSMAASRGSTPPGARNMSVNPGPRQQGDQGWHRDRRQAREPQQRRRPRLASSRGRVGGDAPEQRWKAGSYCCRSACRG